MTISTLILSLLLFGCENKSDDSEFVQMSPWRIFGKKWRELNSSLHGFSVEEKNGELIIKKYKSSNCAELDLHDGKLAGTDRGEWGGKLFFVPNSSTNDTIQIKQGNIKYICKFNNELYFFEGLAHLDYNEGALYQLKREKQGFSFKKIFDFEDAPSAFAVTNEKMYVATESGFCSIDKRMKRKNRYKNMFWGGLYPNSVVILNNKAFVGIRGGYVELHLKRRKCKFYKYNR